MRIGAVSYLNSKPLIEGLSERLLGKGTLTTDLPSRLADQLHAGELDIGLIPVFESFRNANYQAVSTAGIVSRGPVWSVRLLFRCPPASVQTLALDEGSRTSAALSKVLLHDALGSIPTLLPFPIGEAPESIDADAVLIIGDRAMHPEIYLRDFPWNWDLGEVWWRETGLPFVFARWIARSHEFATESIARLLDQTRQEGVDAIENISRRIHSDYQLTPTRCYEYLTRFIHFELTEDAQRGLDEFRRRCHDLKLIS